MATKRSPKKETPTARPPSMADYTDHLVIHGDPHWKGSRVYRNGLVNLTNYIAEKYKGATVISTGDQTDTSAPDWETFDLMVGSLRKFADNSSHNLTYYLDGNHTQSRPKGSLSRGLTFIPGVVAISGEPLVETIGKLKVLFLPHLDWNFAAMQKYDDLEIECDIVVAHATPRWLLPSMPDAISLPKIKAKIIAFGHIHYHKTFVSHVDGVQRNEIIVPVPQPTRLGEEGENFAPQVLIVAPDGHHWMEPLPVFMTIEHLEYDKEPTSKHNLLVVHNAPSEAAVYKRYPATEGYYIHEDAIDVMALTEDEVDDLVSFEKVSSQDIVAKLEVHAASESDITPEEKAIARALLEQAKKTRAQQQAEVA